jgi:FkbM family methyltransferase
MIATLFSKLKNIIFAVAYYLAAGAGMKLAVAKSSNKRLMAVKSDLGFWYAGDIFNRADIAYGIFQNGTVEANETKLVVSIVEFLAKGNNEAVFYDVGANTGYYGIMAASLHSNFSTYSFEPIPEHYTVLKESVGLNGLGNRVTIKPFGISNEEKEADFFVSGSGSTLHKQFLSDGNVPKISIKLRTIDSLVTNSEVTLPHFIKIDVENHEYFVLQGAQKTIASVLPVIFMEIAEKIPMRVGSYSNPHYEKTVSLLKSWGYRIYYLHGEELVRLEDFPRLPGGVHMFLCLHGSAHKSLHSHIFPKHA